MTKAEKHAARGGMSAGAVKKAARARDGFKCVECGMTDAAHRKKYKAGLEVHRKQPGSLYTLAGCIATCRPCNAKLPRLPWGGIDLEQNPKVRSICFELPADFLEEFRAFAKGRKEAIGKAIYHALRRHLKYPPDPPAELPAEPLPPTPLLGQAAEPKAAPKKAKAVTKSKK